MKENNSAIYVILASIVVVIISRIMTAKKYIPKVPTVLREISKKYGKEIAQNVEKIYRLETANFSSGQ